MKLLLCLLLIASALPLFAADYKTPRLTIPYAAQKPVIDGAINDAEWRGALSVDALQTTDKNLSARRTRFWLMWDEDHLYLAMRSPLRAGERPIQNLREAKADQPIVMDDAWEMFVDAGTKSPDGQPVFFQVLSNFAGARFDVLHEPAVGNFRLGWESGWQPKNRLTADNQWEMEVAIPRQSLYRQTPFKEGETLSGLLARDFKRPWEQNSIEGTGSFATRETHSIWTLSRNAPALDFAVLSDPRAQSIGLKLSASGRGGGEPLRWSFRSDAVQREGDLNIGGDAVNLPALDAAGAGDFRVSVTQGQNTLLDWSAHRKFGSLEALDKPVRDRGDTVKLALGFNPVHDYLRVNGDFIGYDARDQIAKTRVEVADATGVTVAKSEFALDANAYVRGLVPLPNLGDGTYKATLVALAPDGKTVLRREQSFEKKDPAQFAWWHTRAGDIERVIAPWTPVKYADHRFEVWGRTIQTGEAGLPAQITALGRDVLAAPAYLRAQTAEGVAPKLAAQTSTLVSAQPHRVVTSDGATLGDLAITSRVSVEFDGMMKIEMRLEPLRATRLRKLQMVVPLRPEIAAYLHASGEGIRSGYNARFLDIAKRGRLWDSTQVDSQPMKKGSFIPFIWLGDARGGLSWFADSDKGWAPDDQTPAIEVRRDGEKSVDLVFNLVSSDTLIDAPRTLTFAFQATPIKPLQDGWRMAPWWTGDTFQDFAGVQAKGGNLIFTSIPFPLDAEKSRQLVAQHHQKNSEFIFGTGKYPAPAVPYFEHIRIGEKFVPEMAYFGDEWKTNVSEGLYYGPSLQDFMVDNLSRWVKSSDIDGFYLDNVNPIADATLEAGRGYKLPDGRVQPEYAIFETRRYLLRLRAAFAEQGKTGNLVLHLTNNFVGPWVGAADIVLDGEMNVIYPAMNQDFMDVWNKERLRLDVPAQWGSAVNFLQEYQGDWDNARLAKAMRSYSGALIAHDVLASSNANGLNQPLWIGRDRFGIEASDVQFAGYWQPNGVQSRAPGVTVSVWKRPGKVLLAVVNWGEATDAQIELNAKTLGLGDAATWKVSDAEANTVVNKSYAHGANVDLPGAWNSASEGAVTRAGATLTVPVKRHDYRQIIVEAG